MHNLFCQLSQILLLASALLFTGSAYSHGWEYATSKAIASCFISDEDGNIMMVQHLASGKYHLPGGIIEDEPPQQTALRHMTQDTGFKVQIGDVIEKIGNHTVFACSLLATKNFFITPQNQKVVIAWSNLYSHLDVTQPYLMPNNDETAAQYARYAETVRFNDWLAQNKPSQFVQVDSGLDIAFGFYRVQHDWLVAVRDWALSFNWVDALAHAFPSVSALVFPLLFSGPNLRQ